MPKADSASTIATPVVPHPSADAYRARTLRRERLRPHRERLEAKITAALEQLEDLRQAFLARLDALHGDCDLEDPGDLEPAMEELEDGADGEPSLGAPEGAQTYSRQRCGTQDGREEDCEDEGAQCDDEGETQYHTCGWRSGEVDQTFLGSGQSQSNRYIDGGK